MTTTSTDSVSTLLDRLAQGDQSPEIIAELRRLGGDPAQLNHILEEMKARGMLDQADTNVMRPEDYYVDKPGKFELQWPLQQDLGIPFEALDRKTQFLVLFTEWTQRELDGIQTRDSGDLPGAEAVFRECLERAQQLDVDELVARSYEELMRVAEQGGDTEGAARWSDQAQAIRGHTQP
jgi:hypothetical protein